MVTEIRDIYNPHLYNYTDIYSYSYSYSHLLGDYSLLLAVTQRKQ
jgi:hypothetical protein